MKNLCNYKVNCLIFAEAVQYKKYEECFCLVKGVNGNVSSSYVK